MPYELIIGSNLSTTSYIEGKLGKYVKQNSSYLFQSHFVGPNAFYQRNSERVQLICLMCFIDDRQWHPKTQAFQVSHLFGQGDNFR